MMRVLVTGSAGFIGFHLSRRCLEAGHSVLGLDSFSTYYDVSLKEARNAVLETYDDFRVARVALEDAEALNAVWTEYQPEIVVHLAAQAGVRYSIDHPEVYVASNLVGTFNVLEAARRCPPRHLLAASTSSAYGANLDMPFRETDKAVHPLTLYAATKSATELMGHSYAHLFGTPTTFFRFFTVYGPWGRPDMALFNFARATLAGEPIEVYGEGKMSRDFTYIDDLIEAILRLAEVPPAEANRVAGATVIDTLSRHAPFRAVNIGGGRPIDVEALVDAVERALGRKARTRLLPMQKGDVPQTFASPDLLQALTGFTPRVDVTDGVRAFVDWYRAYTQTG